jgi:hypothetical protein
LDGISQRSKRRWLVRWSLTQWAALHFALPLYLYGFLDEDDSLDYAEMVFDPGYAGWVAGIAAVLSLAQWLYLRPVRAPRRGDRPVRLIWSVAVAGLAVALLFVALFFAVIGVLSDVAKTLQMDDWVGWTALVVLATNWLMATLLLHSFATRDTEAEPFLRRIAATLFAGTIVEVLAILPFDLVARRHNDCWCARGTLWGVTLGVFAGLVLLGPATLLLLLARRRRRWPGGRCQACGADVGEDLRIARCPACGAGWAAA